MTLTLAGGRMEALLPLWSFRKGTVPFILISTAPVFAMMMI